MCEGVVKTVMINLPKALIKNDDYDSRAELMLASIVAHNNLLDMGRVPGWASHHLGHELSALYDLAHGASLAIITPAWMKYVYKDNMNRFLQFATKIMNVDMNYYDIESTILEGIKKFEDFLSSVGMPVRLSQVKINDSKFQEMVEKATANGDQGNLKKLDKQDVINIYNLAK